MARLLLPSRCLFPVPGTASGPAQSLGYNGLQQLTSDTLTSASGAAIASASYNYNADGDLTQAGGSRGGTPSLRRRRRCRSCWTSCTCRPLESTASPTRTGRQARTPTATPASPEPPEINPDGARFVVGSDGTVTDTAADNGLSNVQKAAIGSGVGAGTNVVDDLVHGQRSGVTGPASPSLELRPKPLRQRALVVVLPVIAGLGAIGIAEHQILGFVVAIVVIVSMSLGSLLKVGITVTPDEIVVADTFGASRHDRAPRSSVAAIHIFSYWVVLTGLNGRSVLRSRPYWTTGQLLDLSEVLGVPLVSHYRMGGWRRRNAPTVVTRAAVPERSSDQDNY